MWLPVTAALGAIVVANLVAEVKVDRIGTDSTSLGVKPDFPLVAELAFRPLFATENEFAVDAAFWLPKSVALGAFVASKVELDQIEAGAVIARIEPEATEAIESHGIGGFEGIADNCGAAIAFQEQGFFPELD